MEEINIIETPVIKDEITDSEKGKGKSLILYNDDHHTFDYVIETLIAVCNLEITQAEQITLLTHYKGKGDVKSGTYDELKPQKQGLIDAGLIASIE